MDRTALVENPKLEIWRKKLNYMLHNLVARVFITALIIADIAIVIVQLATDDTILALDIVSLVFANVFMVEISLRIFAKGAIRYFKRYFCVFEFSIIIITFGLSIATIVLYEDETSHPEAVEYVRLVTSILRAFRILKMLRVFRFVNEYVNLMRAGRYTTSENKRRYIGDGFDLDLCYVTDNIIAMSFPSSGILALYRNPIKKVAEFLNKKHPDKYLVVNMCSERGYDPSFFNGNALRFMVDDHYPPFFLDLVKVVNTLRDWLAKSPEHVVAVHCRGGKGRTGTVICALLLQQRRFEDTDAALEFFAGQRTDLEVGSKYQGVETPSQARYLKYFEQYLAKNEVMPPTKFIKIKKFHISNLMKLERDVLAELSFRIYRGREEIYYGNCFFRIGCQTTANETSDVISITLDEPPVVSEDVKIVFICKKLPTHYWKSAFYFLFHTGFLADNRNENGDGSLFLARAELDNPHKLRKFYGDEFSVETIFCDAPAPEPK